MRVFVLGLDCATPQLLFEKFKNDLENLPAIWSGGYHGKIRSVTPPITIPAWMCMATGKTPGELGIYGFRHRKGYSYLDYWITTYSKIKEKTVWDILGEKGMKSVIVGFPPTYPPRKINGYMVSDFVTPDIQSRFTYPPELREEVLSVNNGEYIFDIVYRTEQKENMKRELWRMTEMQFKVVEHLMKTKEWNLFWYVNIGIDRVHHAFWRYMDKEHHLYEEGNPYENVIYEYYRYVDEWTGKLLSHLKDDDTIIVVSDHGAKRMKGAFCINEYLIEKGYLKLKKYPDKITDLNNEIVDWKNTYAWGWGGYYSRVFLNVEGRERMGIIKPEEYEDFAREIIKELLNVRGPDGEEWKSMVVLPEEIYSTVKGEPPDIMAFFDDLYWRAAGTIGHNRLYLEENDKGPDDAVHDWYGIYASSNKELVAKNITEIRDVILRAFGMEVIE